MQRAIEARIGERVRYPGSSGGTYGMTAMATSGDHQDTLVTTGQADPLLTPKEAARFLRKSISFLAKARMTGTGPEYVQLGRNILYRSSKLILHLEKKSKTSTSQRGSA